jgi:hypothetical protein
LELAVSAADDIKRLASAYTSYDALLVRASALQSERDALLEALRSLVALDDGDNAELWPFADEFEAARVAIKKCEEAK